MITSGGSPDLGMARDSDFSGKEALQYVNIADANGSLVVNMGKPVDSETGLYDLGPAIISTGEWFDPYYQPLPPGGRLLLGEKPRERGLYD
jgi:hypothetical protein